ncbi:multicopper oxidase [Kibdelosporangium philippinense]|uniref:Multicopper oxidase n=1 Tax=Kibdelosporangium philippinense TaxID=211113 RepID=A0ABS8ZBR9_9PSEU|nr:multicopper oxidase [Kibdelosporangium philippinense]MCE7004614.1 multicopper oxidase [Kibdelosporangium philippinense]
MTELTRRELLQLGVAAGASVTLPLWHSGGTAEASVPGATLDPATIPKYVTCLVIPPAMPLTATLQSTSIDCYVIGVRQFSQQVLPPGLPRTTVWGYGLESQGQTFHYPAHTIEARAGRPVRVTWVNGLVDPRGAYLPHLLPVDPTLHWANPPGGVAGRDSRPNFASTPGPYAGPVPIVTHLHGGHNNEESDGYAEAWYLPDAANVPSGFAMVGSRYEEFEATFTSKFGHGWDPGTATFQYDNDQPATTLWFHDHALGVTRLNVYAGLAGFYHIRGGPHDLVGVLPWPAPGRCDPPGTRYYEIPMLVQDRSFGPGGSLFYPDSRAFFDGFAGPYIPDSDISPIWNPEFFGNTMVVNGRTWPVLEVEPRRYRLRLLNGCNSRFLILKLAGDPLAPRPVQPALPIWQIGADGGFLPAPVQLDQLLMAPAERADVIVDFTGVRPGTHLYVINEGPDEPYGGGVPGTDFAPANPATTGQVMRFSVVDLLAPDPSTPPGQITRLPAPPKPGRHTVTRRLSLHEQDSAVLPGVGPRIALLGIVKPDGTGRALGWHEPITETPSVGTTELWELHNFTRDAHPIHIHEVQFEVVERQRFNGSARPPEPGETGLKDTVIALPNEITRVRAVFDRVGLFVWHCHMLEHEDNEMMRPYRIMDMFAHDVR